MSFNFKDHFLIGGKGGGGATFRNRPDNLRSSDTYEMLIGLGTGRIRLAPGGLKNLYVDDVPVEDADGKPIFKDFLAGLWDGDPTQIQPVSLRLGSSAGTTAVGLALANINTSSPGDWVTAAITQPGVDYIDIRLIVQALYKQTKKGNGDEIATIEIEMRPNGAANWINPLLDISGSYNPNGTSPSGKAGIFAYALQASYNPGGSGWSDQSPGYLKIKGKTTSPYVQELRVAVPNSGPYANKTWQIRCRLVEKDYVVSGDDGENESRRTITWESVGGVSSKILGNNEAWRGLSYVQIYGKATDQINGMPEVTGVYDLNDYMVPPNSVWNPVTRQYTGAAWDGVTTQLKWTQCPAWQVKGVIEDGLSGVSALVPGSTLNKWDALEASKWFAQQVPDGKGGFHCRYSGNWFIEEPMQVQDLVNYLAGSVGAFCWDEGDGNWRMKVEKPETPAIIFTRENIVGEFVYSHTDIDSRYNDFIAVFRNAENRYEEDRVRVFDQANIDATGRRHTSLALVGCDNRQEALRRTKLRLLTSINETRMVNFTTNRVGINLEPLSVIAIADGDLNSDTALRSTGRIVNTVENLLLQSTNPTTASWSNSGTGTTNNVAKTVPDGSAGTGYTVSDTDTLSYSRQQAINISADKRTYTASVYFEKTASATTCPALQCDLIGGTLVTGRVVINTNTGTISPGYGGKVESVGNWWRLSFQVTNNGTNTQLRYSVFAAVQASSPTTAPVEAYLGSFTGSTVVTWPQVNYGELVEPYQPTTTTAVQPYFEVRDTLRLEIGVSYKIKLAVPNPNYTPDTTTQPTSDDWRKPTITIERNVTNTNAQRGDVTRIYIDSPLPANTPEYAVVSLDATGLPALPKQYRVLSIVPGDDNETLMISAIEIYTAKWAESDNVSEDAILNQMVNRTVPPPVAPAGGVFQQDEFDSNYNYRRTLVVRWERPATAFLNNFRLEMRHNQGPWQQLGTTRDTYYELANPFEGDYDFRIYAVDRRGAESLPLEGSWTMQELAPIFGYGQDDLLQPAEKIATILEYTRINNEKADILSKASLLSVPTTAYDAEVIDLAIYLGGLSPAWNDTTTTTPITRTAWNAAWDQFYVARQNLLNAITAKAATMSTWGGTSGIPLNLQALTGAEPILNSLVTDIIFADSIIDRFEKNSIVPTLMSQLETEYLQVLANAATANINTAALTSRYNAWKAYTAALTPSLTDVTQDTTIFNNNAFPDRLFSGWSSSGGATASAPSGAYITLTDANAGAAGFYQRGRSQAAAATTYSWCVPIKKDTTGVATRQVRVQISASGGTFKAGIVDIDTATGEFNNANLLSNVDVLDCGVDWLLIGQFTTNADNTSVNVLIYPAFGTNFTSVANAALTGSVTIRTPSLVTGNVFGNLGRDYWVGMIGALRKEMNRITATALSSVAADDVLNKDEKFKVLKPLQSSLEERYQQVSTRATALGISVTNLNTARARWNNWLANMTPAWNDYTQSTSIYNPLFGDALFPTNWTNNGCSLASNGAYLNVSDVSTTVLNISMARTATLAASTQVSWGVGVKKDAIGDTSRFGALRMTFSNGDICDLRFNTATGAINPVQQVGTTAFTASGVLDLGDEWFFYATATSPAGNTNGTLTFYPAAGAASGMDILARTATGTISVYGPPMAALGDSSKLGRHFLVGARNAYVKEMETVARLISEIDAQRAQWSGVTGTGRPEDNADVTKWLDGLMDKTFPYSYDGVAQYTSTSLVYRLKNATSIITTGVVMKYVVLAGSVNGNAAGTTEYAMTFDTGDGSLAVTSLGANESKIEIRAYIGTNRWTLGPVTLKKTFAPAPSAPPAGSSGSAMPITSTANGYAPSGGTIVSIFQVDATVPTGKTAIWLGATATVSAQSANKTATSTVNMKWQRDTGTNGTWTGTWTDIGTSSSAQPTITNYEPMDATLEKSVSDTGRTAGTTYRWRCIIWVSSGSPVNCDATISVSAP